MPDRSWLAHARCRPEYGSDPGDFDAPQIKSVQRRAESRTRAKAVCSRCPVTKQCLADSIAMDIKLGQAPFGIRAGLEPGERGPLLKLERRLRRT